MLEDGITYNVEKDRIKFSSQKYLIDKNTPGVERMMNILKDTKHEKCLYLIAKFGGAL